MKVPKQRFSELIATLREKQGLSIQDLADRAQVPRSLISGLQTGKRRIGELQARKIGRALDLSANALEEFVLLAIDGCSDKLLARAKGYPSIMLNTLALQLNDAGIEGAVIEACTATGTSEQRETTLWLKTGRKAILRTQLIPS